MASEYQVQVVTRPDIRIGRLILWRKKWSNPLRPGQMIFTSEKKAILQFTSREDKLGIDVIPFDRKTVRPGFCSLDEIASNPYLNDRVKVTRFIPDILAVRELP